jgi:hypothetical protein
MAEELVPWGTCLTWSCLLFPPVSRSFYLFFYYLMDVLFGDLINGRRTIPSSMGAVRPPCMSLRTVADHGLADTKH